jgi:type II secretory pathway component PulK
MIKKINKFQKGQTLVMLLVFVMVAIAITTAATFIISSNARAVTNQSLGMATLAMAESGAEKALLQFIRDPSYTGESFTIDTATVTASVSGTTTVTIISTAVNGEFSKRVEVIASYSNNVLTPTSWKEIN